MNPQVAIVVMAAVCAALLILMGALTRRACRLMLERERALLDRLDVPDMILRDGLGREQARLIVHAPPSVREQIADVLAETWKVEVFVREPRLRVIRGGKAEA